MRVNAARRAITGRLRTFTLLVTLAAFVAGCSGQKATETPTPEDNYQPIVSATAVVVPDEWAELSFPIAGQVRSIPVEEGSYVEAGEIVAELDTTSLVMEVNQAKAALALAQANLGLVRSGARAQEIDQAIKQVEAAEAEFAQAVAALDDLRKGASPSEIAAAQAALEAARAARIQAQIVHDNLSQGKAPTGMTTEDALAALNAAKSNLNSAQVALDRLHEGPDEEDLDAAQAAVDAAKAQLKAAKANLEELEDLGASEVEIKAAKAEVSAAEAELASAQAALEALEDGPSDAEIAAAEAAVEQARSAQLQAQTVYDNLRQGRAPDGTTLEQAAAALEAARADEAAAQAALDKLLAGAEIEELRMAEARVMGASSQVDAAQDALDLLEEGASDAELSVSLAQVQQAQSALDTALAMLAKARLESPVVGTVGQVHVREGEWVAPGQPVVTVGNLRHLRVETTDLNEIDVARVKPGQKVTVTFDALPGKAISGRVASISPKSSEGSGVNYTVIVELDGQDGSLRWGMTAFVDIEVEA
jgi:HlyD family secretion protein